MGSYAASGGYYISCPADAIVADKMTLTGSIGVFGMFLDTRDALKNKLGITVDGVKSNASADFAATVAADALAAGDDHARCRPGFTPPSPTMWPRGRQSSDREGARHRPAAVSGWVRMRWKSA